MRRIGEVAAKVLAGMLTLLSLPALGQVLTDPLLPKPSADGYVVVRDGRFMLDGKRIRFWGYNLQAGAYPSYSELTHLVERLSSLGVNAVRVWPSQGTFYDVQSIKEKRFTRVAKGDGSLLDRYDFIFAELKRKGIFVQNTALHYIDVEAIKAWPDPQLKSLLGPKPTPNQIRRWHGIAPYLIEGWESMLATHIRNYLERVNPYTGRRYSDEPIIAGWELANESHFVHCVLRRSCVDTLGPILKAALERHWITYMASTGNAQNVLPVFDANWDRSVSAVHSAYRSFVFERFVAVSRRLEVSARAMGTTGRGVAVQPFTYSTQTGEPLLVARAAHAAGDVSTISVYQTPTSQDRASPYFPYRVNLEAPFFYNANYGAVEGKPTVVYEHSFFRPYPYRVEWPWSMLFVAAVQDWDGLFLYMYGQPWAIYESGEAAPHYGNKSLPIPSTSDDDATKGVGIGFHHGGDEVTVAAWSAAGLAFLAGDLVSGASVRRYAFGPAQVFGPGPGYCSESNGCTGGARQLMAPMNEASLNGPIRIAFSELPGSTITPAPQVREPSRFNSGMNLDRKIPRLIVDTPRTKAVVGLLEGVHQFEGGFAITFTARRFGMVAISAIDGLDLAQSSRIRVSSAGRSSNSGFTFVPDRVQFKRSTGVVSGVVDPGARPLIFERIGFQLSIADRPFSVRRYDFNLRQYNATPRGSMMEVRNDEAIFAAELLR